MLRQGKKQQRKRATQSRKTGGRPGLARNEKKKTTSARAVRQTRGSHLRRARAQRLASGGPSSKMGPELWERVLLYCSGVRDVCAAAQTCRALATASRSQPLWRSLYLRRFREPQTSPRFWRPLYVATLTARRRKKWSSLRKKYDKATRTAAIPNLQPIANMASAKLCFHASPAGPTGRRGIGRVLRDAERQRAALDHPALPQKSWAHENSTCLKVTVPEGQSIDLAAAPLSIALVVTSAPLQSRRVLFARIIGEKKGRGHGEVQCAWKRVTCGDTTATESALALFQAEIPVQLSSKPAPGATHTFTHTCSVTAGVYAPSQGAAVARGRSAKPVAFFYVNVPHLAVVSALLPKGQGLHRVVPDDVDSKYGLHGYSARLSLRSAGSLFWNMAARELFAGGRKPQGGVRAAATSRVFRVTDGDGVVEAVRDRRLARRLVAEEPPLQFPWRTLAFSGCLPRVTILDFTLWDEHKQPIWSISRFVPVQSAQKLAPDMASDAKERAYVVTTDAPQGSLSISVSYNPEKMTSRELRIGQVQFCLTNAFINAKFGTTY